MTRIFLYSTEPVLAQGLTSVLAKTGGFDLLPICTTVSELVDQMTAGRPDTALIDLTPDITFAVLDSLKQQMTSCKTVLWVGSVSVELAFQAMGLGVRGILRKELPIDLQVNCLQKVAVGELWFEKGLTDSFLCARRISLTPREGQLITLLTQGLKNKDIAAKLAISEGTVKVYFSRLFEKVGVRDRFELALFGLKNLTHGQSAVKETGSGVALLPILRSLVIEASAELPAVIAAPFTVQQFRELHLKKPPSGKMVTDRIVG